MKLLQSAQRSEITDPVRSKFAMIGPVLEATLHSLNRARLGRLGGLEHITLWDLSREIREGSGDPGICFEYAVHHAVASHSDLIIPEASEVLEGFCNIGGEAESILFGPEKDGVIPIVESVRDALTDDSVLLVGNRGRPPKLRRYIDQIVNAYHRNEERNRLPRSISGVWKADLFLGNSNAEQWVATTVKINDAHLQGAQGLRIGIYPKRNAADGPRLDDELNLVRLPLPYDSAFMELFYKAFYLVRAFLRNDAHVPRPVDLPDAEDRFITQELEARREFPCVEVIAVLFEMSQQDLLDTGQVEDLQVEAVLSKEGGLTEAPAGHEASDNVSLAPLSREVAV